MAGKLIKLPKIDDPTGSLSVVEGGDTIPFEIKRIYYLHNLSEEAIRGCHAHRKLRQFFIAISGSFEVILHDGLKEFKYMLDDPGEGLLVPSMTWRTLKNFSSGAVCCVLASDHYSEIDYIRDFDQFLKSIE